MTAEHRAGGYTRDHARRYVARAGCGSGRATRGAGQTEELALKRGRFPELQFSSVRARAWCRQRRGSRSAGAAGRGAGMTLRCSTWGRPQESRAEHVTGARNHLLPRSVTDQDQSPVIFESK